MSRPWWRKTSKAWYATIDGKQELLCKAKSKPSADSETYAVGRAMAYALMNTFGMKMAAIFIFVTSTIGFRTGVLARWVSFVGFALV